MISFKAWRLLIGVCGLALLWTLAAGCQRRSWADHMASGEKAYRNGQYDRAAKFFSAALEQAEGFDPLDPRLATTLNDLALVYDAQGKLAQAESLYKRALAIWEKGPAPKRQEAATALNNLAALYRAQGRQSEAVAVRKRAQVTLAGGSKRKDQGLAAALLELAALYQSQGKPAEADSMIRQYLTLLEGAVGRDDPDMAPSLEKYAALLRMAGRNAEAAHLEARARAIRAKSARGNSRE